jgi:hypothetical protein
LSEGETKNEAYFLKVEGYRNCVAAGVALAWRPISAFVNHAGVAGLFVEEGGQ